MCNEEKTDLNDSGEFLHFTQNLKYTVQSHTKVRLVKKYSGARSGVITKTKNFSRGGGGGRTREWSCLLKQYCLLAR